MLLTNRKQRRPAISTLRKLSQYSIVPRDCSKTDEDGNATREECDVA